MGRACLPEGVECSAHCPAALLGGGWACAHWRGAVARSRARHHLPRWSMRPSPDDIGSCRDTGPVSPTIRLPHRRLALALHCLALPTMEVHRACSRAVPLPSYSSSSPPPSPPRPPSPPSPCSPSSLSLYPHSGFPQSAPSFRSLSYASSPLPPNLRILTFSLPPRSPNSLPFFFYLSNITPLSPPLARPLLSHPPPARPPHHLHLVTHILIPYVVVSSMLESHMRPSSDQSASPRPSMGPCRAATWIIGSPPPSDVPLHAPSLPAAMLHRRIS